MQEYIISISKEREWNIELKENIGKDVKLDKIDISLPFGQWEIYKGEVNYLFDIWIDDKMIKEVEDISFLSKKAKFFHKNKSFVGSFYDALNYIKKEFKCQTAAKSGKVRSPGYER